MKKHQIKKEDAEYRELWNMINARQIALQEELYNLKEIKVWIDKRLGIESN